MQNRKLTQPNANALPHSRKQDEVVTLEMQIRQRSEQQKKAGVELDATCHICLKTKFADGVGHICHYCNIRCCARCGGKVTLRSNKVSRGGTSCVFMRVCVCISADSLAAAWQPDSLTHFPVGNFQVPLDAAVTRRRVKPAKWQRVLLIFQPLINWMTLCRQLYWPRPRLPSAAAATATAAAHSGGPSLIRPVGQH